MKKKLLFNKDFLIIIFLFVFATLLNQYYGNRGAFPHDSFAHFETGYRILNGEHPFTNYWIISGPLVDYIQSLFFFIFGVSFQSYVLHASVFNGILTVATFKVLRNFNLNTFHSFIYAFFFSILAYPSSGTPFVDHHSTFFSLLGVYAILIAMRSEDNIYWIIAPILFICAFFSKQVPVSYLIIPIFVTLCFYFFNKKKTKAPQYFLSSSIIFILTLLFFGLINGINIYEFINQYILYPQFIGQDRFAKLLSNFSIFGIVSHFKFILIVLALFIYLNVKNIYSIKKYYNQNSFYYFIIISTFAIFLIFNQILTKNQTYIFFLIPIIAGFVQIYSKNNRVSFNYIILIFCLFITVKYHLRFNEDRKFHELSNSNFNLAINAKKIDDKLNGLKWITPQFNNDPKGEIKNINEIKNIIKGDKREKMVLSNYPFLSVILDEKYFSPTRWHTFDGTDYPQVGSKYISFYQDLIIKTLKKNSIQVVYTIFPVNEKNIYNYVNRNCFIEKKINEYLSSYTLKSCYQLNLP